jgi:hypothetical protein
MTVLFSTNKSASQAERKVKKTSLISITLLALAANFAVARDRNTVAQNQNDQGCRGNSRCVSAPEIDPAQAMGALTLLGGTLAIVRGYRRGKK